MAVELNGQKYEVSEAPRADGRVRFLFERNRIALRPSVLAVAEGVQAGEAGKFEEAMECFERAARADRFDPWPTYHRGGTLLHLRRYQEAADALADTEELAPGFYHCRSDRWLATMLAARKLDHETFLAVRQLSDGNVPPPRGERVARRAIEKAPIGLLFLGLGDVLSKMKRTEEAEKAYRKGLEVAEEPDVKTRLLTHLGANLADEGEKSRLLGEAIELQGNLVAAAMAVVALAASRGN